MIQRNKGEITLICDECGEKVYGGTLSWEDFWHEAKAEGWKASKVEDTWEHFCDECAQTN